jgi:TonB family protein
MALAKTIAASALMHALAIALVGVAALPAGDGAARGKEVFVQLLGGVAGSMPSGLSEQRGSPPASKAAREDAASSFSDVVKKSPARRPLKEKAPEKKRDSRKREAARKETVLKDKTVLSQATEKLPEKAPAAFEATDALRASPEAASEEGEEGGRSEGAPVPAEAQLPVASGVSGVAAGAGHGNETAGTSVRAQGGIGSFPPGVGAGGVPGGDRAGLIARIREAIERATTYPPLARRRRLEGTVLAAFFINEKGMPEEIRVLESSGYGILDREVVSIIERASPYPPLGESIEVPISFRLIKGN